MTEPNVVFPDTQPDSSAVDMPASSYSLQFINTERAVVIQLDRIRPEYLADTDRRELRVMEALLQEGITNVRDALLIRAREGR